MTLEALAIACSSGIVGFLCGYNVHWTLSASDMAVAAKIRACAIRCTDNNRFTGPDFATICHAEYSTGGKFYDLQIQPKRPEHSL